jgi:hypothetical protein
MRVRRLLVASAAALGIAAAAPVIAPAASPSIQSPVVTKTCSGGFRHGVIGGAEKCLRAGEFCARRFDRQYRRYGYRCVSTDARGSYHLTRS